MSNASSQPTNVSASKIDITIDLRKRLRIILWIATLSFVFTYIGGQIHAAYQQALFQKELLRKYMETVVRNDQYNILSAAKLHQIHLIEAARKKLEKELGQLIPGMNSCVVVTVGGTKLSEPHCSGISNMTQISLSIDDSRSRNNANVILSWSSPDEIEQAVRRSFPSLFFVLFGALSGTSLIFWLIERDVMKPIVDMVRRRERDAAFIKIVHTLAHDIRRPLNMIKVFLGFVRSTDSMEEVRKQTSLYSAAIERSASAVLDNLNDVLTTGTTPKLHMRETSLSQLIKQSYQEVELALGRSIRTFSVTDRFNHRVVADPHKLKRIFDNILMNAVEETGPDGVIKVEIYSEQDKVFVTISNSGREIPPEDLEKIFELYHSVGKPLGTGLGLSIANEFAKVHGGALACANIPSFGVRFTLSLPRRVSDTPINDDVTKRVEFGKRLGEGRRLRILLVEDDLIYQDNFRLIISRLNIPGISLELDVVSTSDEAIESLGKKLPDVIVSDYYLGESSSSDGERLLSAVKMIAPWMPCYLYSNMMTRPPGQECLEKPVSIEALENLVNYLILKNQVNSASKTPNHG